MRKLKEYLNRPLSFVMFLLIIISTVITALTVVFIIGYIFIKGVPNLSLDLFSLKYSSSNQSMLPSIINTVYLTALTLLLSVPIGIFFGNLFGGIFKEKFIFCKNNKHCKRNPFRYSVNSLRLVRIFGIRDFKKMGLFAFGRCNHACNNGFAPYYKDVAGGNAWC